MDCRRWAGRPAGRRADKAAAWPLETSAGRADKRPSPGGADGGVGRRAIWRRRSWQPAFARRRAARDSDQKGVRRWQAAEGTRLVDRLGTRSAWSPGGGEGSLTKGRGRRLQAATAGPFDGRPSVGRRRRLVRGRSEDRPCTARSVARGVYMSARGLSVLSGRCYACRRWPAIRAGWPAGRLLRVDDRRPR
jgi:hypothetical protein